ncbi:MAG: hypothetical protein WKF82_02840 [Nocardioidaceae bacterium]
MPTQRGGDRTAAPCGRRIVPAVQHGHSAASGTASTGAQPGRTRPIAEVLRPVRAHQQAELGEQLVEGLPDRLELLSGPPEVVVGVRAQRPRAAAGGDPLPVDLGEQLSRIQPPPQVWPQHSSPHRVSLKPGQTLELARAVHSLRNRQQLRGTVDLARVPAAGQDLIVDEVADLVQEDGLTQSSARRTQNGSITITAFGAGQYAVSKDRLIVTAGVDGTRCTTSTRGYDTIEPPACPARREHLADRYRRLVTRRRPCRCRSPQTPSQVADRPTRGDSEHQAGDHHGPHRVAGGDQTAQQQRVSTASPAAVSTTAPTATAVAILE